jgi:hypothetical protein
MPDMKILINDKKTIETIQKEFNLRFPYLKIEFFSRPHKIGEGSSKKIIKSTNQTLGECRKVHKDGQIKIVPQMKVSELEQMLTYVYGLSVQIFRKSGKSWLETTVTDGWTLEEQNKEGEELSSKIG